MSYLSSHPHYKEKWDQAKSKARRTKKTIKIRSQIRLFQTDQQKGQTFRYTKKKGRFDWTQTGKGHNSTDSTEISTRGYSEQLYSNLDNLDEPLKPHHLPGLKGEETENSEEISNSWRHWIKKKKKKQNTPNEEILGWVYFFMGEFYQSFNDKWIILIKTFQKIEE